jgi:hypothetical protein
MAQADRETQDGDLEYEVFYPGCSRCGCSTFVLVRPPIQADDAEKLAEDRYKFHPVWVTIYECTNCGLEEAIYTSD